MEQFNKNAKAYDKIRSKITYPQALYRYLAERAPATSAALDIGCGNGVSSIRLKDYFSYVEGCDLGEALIERARVNYPELSFTVSPAETFSPERTFDLITSATSFYWMDRKAVLTNLKSWLRPEGLFCAYRYDVPIIYGPLRDYIEKELVTHWAAHRDPRLIQYDDTLELMRDCPHLQDARREAFANILFLSAEEVALFFLSTSYASRFIELEGGETYRNNFVEKVMSIGGSEPIAVNFDIHAFSATYLPAI
ncbi:class I SAM-dependent methyltransferase [Kosakonia radicincitans]|uniref:class I SAM-dependent methyltransferase n=1 Tax=Kosakonia radicincitans TaxID=283686 RepID=UPI0005C32578|nr:class I SAM-dependent methyltransferase [Kosakonia radicincitans]KIS41325.1 methyltransferase domain protein [Kosakonia radicincitans YD4]